MLKKKKLVREGKKKNVNKKKYSDVNIEKKYLIKYVLNN